MDCVICISADSRDISTEPCLVRSAWWLFIEANNVEHVRADVVIVYRTISQRLDWGCLPACPPSPPPSQLRITNLSVTWRTRSKRGRVGACSLFRSRALADRAWWNGQEDSEASFGDRGCSSNGGRQVAVCGTNDWLRWINSRACCDGNKKGAAVVGNGTGGYGLHER